MTASTLESEPGRLEFEHPATILTYRTPVGEATRPYAIFIDALSGPDGITCPRCRRARSVGIKTCEFCDEDHFIVA